VKNMYDMRPAVIIGEGLTAALTALRLKQRGLPFVRVKGGEQCPESHISSTAAGAGCWSALCASHGNASARRLAEVYLKGCRALGHIAALTGSFCTAVPVWYFSDSEAWPLIEEASAAAGLGIPAAFVPRPERLFAAEGFAERACAVRCDGSLLLSAAALTGKINALCGCDSFADRADDAAVFIDIRPGAEGHAAHEMILEGGHVPTGCGVLEDIGFAVTPNGEEGRFSLRLLRQWEGAGFAALESIAAQLFPHARRLAQRTVTVCGEGFRFPEITCTGEDDSRRIAVSAGSHPVSAMVAAEQAAGAAERIMASYIVPKL